MESEQIVTQVKDLEERFLAKDVDSGNPAAEGDGSEVDSPDDQYDEVEALMSLTENSATSCMIAIEQLLRRGHKEKLKEMFGDEAEDLLKKTQENLSGIVALFEHEDEEEDEEEEEDSEDSEKEPEEKEEPEADKEDDEEEDEEPEEEK